jgi:NADH:ubiquinone oxidoreductase subunit 5 (subunit L)/multisubunit Na+/H+ antiporter MnhA subunit
MGWFINIFILLPVLGFVLSLIIPKRNEYMLSWVAFTSVGAQLFTAIGFIVYWLFNQHEVLNLKEFSIFKANNYDFYIDFYFDHVTMTYLIIGALLTFIITVYSRYYFHKAIFHKKNY